MQLRKRLPRLPVVLLLEPGPARLRDLSEALDEAVAQAAFVCLDRDKTEAVEFSDDLAALSQQVLQRLRELFGEMHRGAPLPAQGADDVCGYCEMRGLCRKDYWQT